MSRFSISPCIPRRLRSVLIPALLGAAFALPAAAARAPQALHDFEASGPLRLAPDQMASLCVTNYGSENENILLALVDATPGSNPAGILASQQVRLAPHASACLNVPGANLWVSGPQLNVIGLVVGNGFVNQGRIQQGLGASGGGCIASLQILDALSKTTSIAQMASHRVQGP